MIGQALGDGRYIIKRLIGTGGSADVYEASDTRLSRPVAIKVLHRRVVDDPHAVANLQAEVQLSRTLGHPGVVEVYEYEAGDECRLVMEYMPGGDLRRRLLSVGRIPATEVERIARTLLDTLSAAHAHGIVHRDLKPRNVLFDESGHAKIADLGLARSVSAAGLHEAGVVAGTPEYTAPESVTASLWDARTDLYALGCTLFEAATGNPPYTANTPAEVLRMQVEAPVPDAQREIPGPLGSLIASLLSKDPNNRPQTAADAIADLKGSSPLPVLPGTESRCPTCGAAMSGVYRWCFTCGRPDLPALQTPKGYSVLVTGPGKPGEKTPSDFRDACCEVAAAAGLDAARLQKSVPRIPFVLAGSLDYGGARRLAAEVRAVGGSVSVVGPGEERRSTLIRSIAGKAVTMTPRIYLVIGGMGFWWFRAFDSMSGVAVIAALGVAIVGVPLVLLGTFLKPVTAVSGEGPAVGANMARLLGTVRDPLIHARMKSITETATALAKHVDQPEWGDQVTERAAALCLALDSARSARRLVEETAGESGKDLVAARTAAEQLRKVEGTYTRTLELLGSTALELREYSLRAAHAETSTARSGLKGLRSVVERLGDEGAAWREIEELGGTRGND